MEAIGMMVRVAARVREAYQQTGGDHYLATLWFLDDKAHKLLHEMLYPKPTTSS